MNQFVADQHIDNTLKHYYFRNFRWLLHLVYWLFVYVRNQLMIHEPVFFAEGFIFNFLFDNLFIITFYYFYALVLLPVYLKKNKFRQFATGFLLALLVLPLLDLVFHYNFIQYQPERYHYLSFENPNWPALAQRMYNSYVLNFLIFVSYLFLIETADSMAKFQAGIKDDVTISKSQRQLLQTQLEPEFIMNTLTGISTLASSNNRETPNTIVQFSEILRYRLYQSKAEQISLSEELRQIKNLFDLQNKLNDSQYVLEVEGETNAVNVYSSSLLSLIIKILSTSNSENDTKIVLYILTMQTEVDIAIEWESSFPDKLKVVKELRKQLAEFYEARCRFDFDVSEELCSIRIHLAAH